MSQDMILNILIPGIAVIVGLFLKRAPWYNTKFVPIASFVVALISRFIQELIGQPAAADEVALASLFAFSWGQLWIIVRAAIDAIIATGVQSAPKNILEGLKGQRT